MGGKAGPQVEGGHVDVAHVGVALPESQLRGFKADGDGSRVVDLNDDLQVQVVGTGVQDADEQDLHLGRVGQMLTVGHDAGEGQEAQGQDDEDGQQAPPDTGYRPVHRPEVVAVGHPTGLFARACGAQTGDPVQIGQTGQTREIGQTGQTGQTRKIIPMRNMRMEIPLVERLNLVGTSLGLALGPVGGPPKGIGGLLRKAGRQVGHDGTLAADTAAETALGGHWSGDG